MFFPEFATTNEIHYQTWQPFNHVDKAGDPAIGSVKLATVKSGQALGLSSSNHSLLRWILSLSEMAKMELFLELSFRFQAESRYGEAEFLAFTG